MRSFTNANTDSVILTKAFGKINLVSSDSSKHTHTHTQTQTQITKVAAIGAHCESRPIIIPLTLLG